MWPPDGTSLSFFSKEFHAQTSVTAMSSGIRKRSQKHLFLSNVARQQRTLEISVSFLFPLLLKSLKLVCSQAPWSWFKNSKILTSLHPLLTQAVLFHYCPFIWVLVGGTSISSVRNSSHRCVHSLLCLSEVYSGRMSSERHPGHHAESRTLLGLYHSGSQPVGCYSFGGCVSDILNIKYLYYNFNSSKIMIMKSATK